MNYVDYCLKLYKSFIDSDSEKYSLSLDSKSFSLVDLVSKKFSDEQIKEQYSKETKSIITDRLSALNIENEYKDELKNLSYYFDSVGRFTMVLIFWIEYNKVKLSKEELYKISEAMIIGSIGYRLIDIHFDDGLMGKETAIVGNYFIHIYEEILMDVFNEKESFKIISKNVRLYSEVEFLEKRSKWKTCPFSWDEAERIGLKTAPLYSTFELILRRTEKGEKEIESLLKGLVYNAAAIQLQDDFSDTVEDLAKGFETLVMSGFYKKFGTDIEITEELVKSFLNDENILRFYNTNQSLYDKARNIFTKYEDDILLLTVEVQNYNFSSHLV